MVAGRLFEKDGQQYTLLVDDADISYLFGALHIGKHNGVMRVHVGKQLLHRVLTNAPSGLVVDHIDGNPFNNQRDNLRVCTQKANCENARKTTKPTSSKFKGVHLYKRTGRWTAGIRHDYKKIHLGSFATQEGAAVAYNQAAERYFGSVVCLNKV